MYILQLNSEISSPMSQFFLPAVSIKSNSHNRTGALVLPFSCIASTLFPYYLLQMCVELFHSFTARSAAYYLQHYYLRTDTSFRAGKFLYSYCYRIAIFASMCSLLLKSTTLLLLVKILKLSSLLNVFNIYIYI